ncbi:MAG: spore coat protein CotJB [Bacilli bacterium]|nr:spore coat protein CotJB [Bacilli bacterium]
MNNYINYDWYRNTNMNMLSFPNVDLFTPTEGYDKGNLFRNIYSQYKNYRPITLRPKSEKEKKLFELSAVAFAAHELNLYLDLHPEDQSMLALFNDYRRKSNELIKEYEENYGPLTVSSDALEGNTFTWEKDTWPWEGKNV